MLSLSKFLLTVNSVYGGGHIYKKEELTAVEWFFFMTLPTLQYLLSSFSLFPLTLPSLTSSSPIFSRLLFTVNSISNVVSLIIYSLKPQKPALVCMTAAHGNRNTGDGGATFPAFNFQSKSVFVNLKQKTKTYSSNQNLAA